MRRVSRVQTSDGVLHNSERDARAYCERRVGPLLTHHAHTLVHIDKYTGILEYLESNLDAFAEARRWKMEAEGPLETDDD